MRDDWTHALILFYVLGVFLFAAFKQKRFSTLAMVVWAICWPVLVIIQFLSLLIRLALA